MSESTNGELRLEGVFTVLPTAFRDDGGLDHDGIVALVDIGLAAGVAGFTVLGVMGEAAELTEDERRAVLALVVDRAGDVPVVVGVTGPTAAIVAARAAAALEAGARGLMVSPTTGVTLPVAADAAATSGLPIILQDYPAGSGVEVAVDEIVAVARRNRSVAGVKAEALPTAGKIARMVGQEPGLRTMGGLGGLFLIDELRAGATGVMTGFALPERLVRIVSTFAVDAAAAEADWLTLLPLMRFEAFPPFSLAARKEVWRLRGVIRSARCRRVGAVLDDRSARDVGRALAAVRDGTELVPGQPGRLEPVAG